MLWTMDMFLVKAKKDQATFWDFKQKKSRGVWSTCTNTAKMTILQF